MTETLEDWLTPNSLAARNDITYLESGQRFSMVNVVAVVLNDVNALLLSSRYTSPWYVMLFAHPVTAGVSHVIVIVVKPATAWIFSVSIFSGTPRDKIN